ncbi:uncharacterized protein LOC122060234 [Macadamia integrifolia]|uniref:uncharacterized protein LOC122060234 n=1 Tax=Macadamia integrifolia TaxID=60698 RepID=UPI001C4ED000|nr:uncharacterized protein LOC122060234 [Macadamia integrifolia]
MVQSIISSINGSSVFLPNLSQPSSRKSWCRKTRLRRYPMTLAAARGDNCGGGSGRGRLVDENMIVLRKRIQEMKMVESNQEAPEEWMEWEKRYYTDYDSDVCEAVGLLQTQLMKTRPSVALGMVALVTLSVPTSTFMVALQLMEMARKILSEIHL